ncbi:Type 1 glutamine amidotransferase-like domain-containing protein [Chitinimonas sp.]|uniref:Type 1 glutamine amidotransferase-like domain-containing protein n=1 Tax=Chitinimonas sp. TaxID=1934313 RepID=UPI0035AED652
MVARQLIVLGGGGFSMENSPLLDRYFLAATAKERPKICFVATASGDAADYQLKFFRAHAAYPCQASQLSLFRPHTADLRSFVLEQDAIFVGGGNTRSMLALWREWQLDQHLREAYEAGVVIGGISAGMICWFDVGLTDSIPGPLTALPGLGWLPGGACPHYDGETARRPGLHAMVGSGAMPDSWAADDGAALHFIDEQLHRAVCSRPDAKAWRITRSEPGLVCEKAMTMHYPG